MYFIIFCSCLSLSPRLRKNSYRDSVTKLFGRVCQFYWVWGCYVGNQPVPRVLLYFPVEKLQKKENETKRRCSNSKMETTVKHSRKKIKCYIDTCLIKKKNPKILGVMKQKQNLFVCHCVYMYLIVHYLMIN